MRRNWILAFGLATTTALGGALAVPALAQGPHNGRSSAAHETGGHGMMGDHSDMMEMMQRMHGQGMGDMMGGMGPMRGGMMADMMQAFDADGDGAVTPDELRTGLEGRLTEYDADGDGTLSIEEFETLHSAMIREHMVDRFQHLDADGDGAVTAEEITAPADRMERMQQRREQMMDARSGLQSGEAPAMQDMGDDGMMDDGMMQDRSADD